MTRIPDSQTIDDYIDAVKLQLVASPVVKNYKILRERSTQDEGYLCIQIELMNNDILDVAEYFEVRLEKIETIDYRYHWMDASNQLRCRWDNAPHHPSLDNFPHHIHQASEDNVLPGVVMNLIQLLDHVANEVS